MQTRRIHQLLLFFYSTAAVIVGAAALILPGFRARAYAPLREWILPPPPPIVVEMLYSTEKRAWLEAELELFYRTNPRQGGRPIEIHLEPMGSREIVLAVMDGRRPDVISPAGSLQVSILEELSRSEFGSPVVNRMDPEQCQSVVTTPLVLIAWEERANVLFRDADPEELWSELGGAIQDPAGWAAFGQPDWGYVKFSHTNPLSSNSGFMAILLMTYDYFGISRDLSTSDLLSNQEFQSWFLAFENAVSTFEYSTGPLMEKMITYGPSSYDIAAVYEATAIENIENAVGKYGELRVFYPPATVWSDHPFCVLNADWVEPETAAAAGQFIAFLSQEESVRKALIEYGFRSSQEIVPLDIPGSPFTSYSGNGFTADLSQIPEIEIPDGAVLNTLLEFWSRSIAR